MGTQIKVFKLIPMLAEIMNNFYQGKSMYIAFVPRTRYVWFYTIKRETGLENRKWEAITLTSANIERICGRKWILIFDTR